MAKCEKCKEKVNLLNAYVYYGPSWIRWECPKCNYAMNYERIDRPLCKENNRKVR